MTRLLKIEAGRVVAHAPALQEECYTGPIPMRAVPRTVVEYEPVFAVSEARTAAWEEMKRQVRQRIDTLQSRLERAGDGDGVSALVEGLPETPEGNVLRALFARLGAVERRQLTAGTREHRLALEADIGIAQNVLTRLEAEPPEARQVGQAPVETVVEDQVPAPELAELAPGWMRVEMELPRVEGQKVPWNELLEHLVVDAGGGVSIPPDIGPRVVATRARRELEDLARISAIQAAEAENRRATLAQLGLQVDADQAAAQRDQLVAVAAGARAQLEELTK